MSNAALQTGPLRHFLQFSDLTKSEILYVLERARLIKDKFKHYQPHHTLHDRTLAMVFEKASTRTRVSFEAGMYQLGGSVIHLTTGDSQLGRAEPIEDTARVISRMVDLVMIRTFEQTRLEPKRIGSPAAGVLQEFDDPMQACRGAHLVTTDVWTSMGYEAENDARRKAFADWCVDADMMAVAAPDAVFMHCLPAHRGEEVTGDVIDGPQSVVWDEAENRLHVQKALMEFLLLGQLPTPTA
jgi:ornithine carbamoyltransferase